MDRAFLSNVSGTPPVAPGVPLIGYPQAGDPQTGTKATKPGAFWFHMMTEEVRNVIVAAGITPDHDDLTQLLSAIQALIAASGMPIGAVVPYASSSVLPTGFLKANAAVLAQASYPTLYGRIGGTFNTGGEGAGNFRLPELRQEFIQGWADGRTGGPDDGRVFGSWKASQLKAHGHRIYGDDTGSGPNGQVASALNYPLGGSGRNGSYLLNNSAIGQPIIENTGGNDTYPRSVALLYIIRAY